MSDTHIAQIHAREILDSRATPALEVEVTLQSGAVGRAAVPSGASTGRHEAVELRDHDQKRYHGHGVLRAQGFVNGEINDTLRGFDAQQQRGLDEALRQLDGTENFARIGANAALGVSLAAAQAVAADTGTGLYRYLGGRTASMLPAPLFNVLNGGVHAGNALDVQEFMLIPVGAGSFADALRMGAEIYHALRAALGGAGIGDEGGFAPDFSTAEQALDALMRAIERAGYRPGIDCFLALDAAASEWYENDVYHLPKSGRIYSRTQLVERWCALASQYPLLSLEDGMGEDDKEGWCMLHERLGNRVQLVGDDLFVTDARRIAHGMGLANAVLIKPNQVGTLTGTIDAVAAAERMGFSVILSHRSGETEDTVIADLAVALHAQQLKAGAPCRGERTAKYNRLLRIADQLGGETRWAGRAAFANFLR